MWGVGKTSLVQRFVSSICDDKYHSILGVKIDKEVISFEGKEATFVLWDVAGSEDQFTIPTHYLYGASGYLIIVDETRKASLDCALDLVQWVAKNMGPVPYIPVINKSDLIGEIGRDDVVHLLGQDRQVFQSSAKTVIQEYPLHLAVPRTAGKHPNRSMLP